MPQITNISSQKRNADIYNIEVDGKFVCGLGALEVSSRGLRVGQAIEVAEVDQLIASSQGAKAYNAALRYLSYRPRSEFEVKDYLARKDYSPEMLSATLDKLMEARFVNDEDFARSWVRSRQAAKPKSKRALSVELAKKRVPRDIVDMVLADVEDEDELSSLKEVATKKIRLSRYSNDKQKLTQYLLGQGYKYSDVQAVLEELAAHDDETNYGSNNS